jgi:hypothetical protein
MMPGHHGRVTVLIICESGGCAMTSTTGQASTTEQDGAMSKSQQQAAGGFGVNSGLLISGAVLAGLGSLLGAAGLALGCTALAGAARRWLGGQELPPSQLARQQLAKAKAATVAGATTWRNHTPQPAHRS